MTKQYFKNLLKEDDLQWKTTSNGRRPQNIKMGISQQPFIGSYSNVKLMLQWKMTSGAENCVSS